MEVLRENRPGAHPETDAHGGTHSAFLPLKTTEQRRDDFKTRRRQSDSSAKSQ